MWEAEVLLPGHNGVPWYILVHVAPTMANIQMWLSLVHVTSNKGRTTPALHDSHASSAMRRLNWCFWRSDRSVTWETIKYNHQDFNVSKSDEPCWDSWGLDQLRIYQWFMQRIGWDVTIATPPLGGKWCSACVIFWFLVLLVHQKLSLDFDVLCSGFFTNTLFSHCVSLIR